MGSVESFLLMYGSHCMRHIGFRRLTVVNGTLGFWGVTKIIYVYIYSESLTDSLHICICQM